MNDSSRNPSANQDSSAKLLWLRLLPLALFVALCVFFLLQLQSGKPERQSALVERNVPEFNVRSLLNPEQMLSNKDMPSGPYLINVWGSWCVACYAEHGYLDYLNRNKVIPIVGLNYKDREVTALDFLESMGDPFTTILFDESGRLGVEFGVYGAPETFLVDADGIIRARHIGELRQDIWFEKFVPVLGEAYRHPPIPMKEPQQ